MRWLTIGLILTGGGISILTLFAEARPDQLCLTSGCASVLSSPYAVFLGIPLGVWGMLYYTLLLITFLKNFSRMYGILLSIGLTVSGILTYLEFFIIHAVCPYCLSSASIILILSLYYAALRVERRMMYA